MKTMLKSLNSVVFAVILALVALGLVISLRLGQLQTANASPKLYVQVIEPHPFGPGWAADYGYTHHPKVDPNTGMPFGPGWAADYGTASASPVLFGPEIAATYGARTVMNPFGPEIAANYGKRSVTANPFGPEIAATYGMQSTTVRPFGPGWVATYGVPAK